MSAVAEMIVSDHIGLAHGPIAHAVCGFVTGEFFFFRIPSNGPAEAESDVGAMTGGYGAMGGFRRGPGLLA